MNKAMLSHDKGVERSDQIQWALSLRAIPYPATRNRHYCGEYLFSGDNGGLLTWCQNTVAYIVRL